ERRALEPSRRDTDHREIAIVYANRLLDGIGRRVEVCLPVSVGNHHHRLGSWTLRLARHEESAECGLQAECREVVPGHEQAIRALGASGLADVERHHSKSEQLAK